ncbi:dihydrodipicolinate synthase family protein [Natronoglomus mannanivorans]|uniref:Dihydrodipicolinate synthase family protein n=1 Tax=Natronoglomus mannanivorans TaxID=2979990 RepID=A0AAP2YZI8_9EURY|nr:dihydrodipicolinate synthase family protein [Halobacteria archaeon AArc-xg1-1]
MPIQNALRGITCPIVTPFDDTVDEAALESLLEHVQTGVDAVFPCGTTGEFASLSADERRRVLEATVDCAEVPVVAGAAATSVAKTVEYVADADAAGADAAVIVPPYFHTANAPDGDRQFFEAVADRVSLPLLLYNIPQCTGQRIDPETVAAAADHDRIVGLKDSGGDLEYFLSVQRKVPDEFLCLQGYDALLVPALRMGADGGVNALSNALPDVFAETIERAHDARGARLQREAITPVFEACTEFGFAPAAKAALVHRGVLPTDDVRPPLVPIDDPATLETAVDRALEVADSEDR